MGVAYNQMFFFVYRPITEEGYYELKFTVYLNIVLKMT